MPQRDAEKLFEDIRRAAGDLAGFCEGVDLSSFKADRKLQLAVERGLEIIGEAVIRLRNEHEALAHQITDAHKIAGMRNVLAHGYDSLDYEILWDAVENKLPVLVADIDRLSGL